MMLAAFFDRYWSSLGVHLYGHAMLSRWQQIGDKAGDSLRVYNIDIGLKRKAKRKLFAAGNSSGNDRRLVHAGIERQMDIPYISSNFAARLGMLLPLLRKLEETS
jgi:hypothetical protein